MKPINQLICAVLLLCSLCTTTLSGQEKDQLFTVDRFTLQSGQESTFKDMVTKMTEAYVANGINRDIHWFRRDDGDYEVYIPVADYADVERLDYDFSYAYNSQIDTVARAKIYDQAVWPKVVKEQRNLIMKEIAELSYQPEGDEKIEGIAPYLEVTTYRLKPGVSWMDLRTKAREWVSLMEERDSPSNISFFVPDLGGDSRSFQVEIAANSAADLARRRSMQEGLADETTKQWQNDVSQMVEETGKTVVEYLPEMSNSDHDKYQATMLVVQRNYVSATEMDDYRNAIKISNAGLRAGKADLYWHSYVLDNGQAIAMAPIEGFSGMDEVYDKLRRRSYQIEPDRQEAYKRAREKVDGVYSEMNIMKYHHEMSYQPSGDQADLPRDYLVLTELEVKPGKMEEMMELAEERAAKDMEMGSKTPYQLYTYRAGGASNRIVIAEFGPNAEALESSMAADEEALGSWKQDFRKRLEEVIESVSVAKGAQDMEMSYLEEK
ncbi:hypothetical protein LEM8419_02620 [Neolewinella maritima]|uniref:Uncharacterized protein n=1 Tax=Neolewinella maritima TaxID=1383882 RepID=A0ABM9B3F3_9BACT|nr:hypothetical protein [Neolewinella maritima]CAH1001714.1 hypothetical protein LEM8419_02620 [Neolewinella maritima]